MSITSDFHLHTSFSEDSDAPMESMCRAAAAAGLKTICFTEHLDLDYPPECGSFQVDLERCTNELFLLRCRWQDTLSIRLGLELGMQPGLANRYQKIAARYPFDFLIASQHLVDGRDPYYPDFWQSRGEREVYERYFSQLLQNLKSMKEYDTLGHLDYIVRYGPDQNSHYSFRAYAASIDPILRHLIDSGKCLEVNSAGLKYGLKHPNPEESVLRRYRELGGELITIGSDAHCPEHIAYDFAKVEAILKEIGFHYYFIFKDRKRTGIPL